jgi:hypothetical protein
MNELSILIMPRVISILANPNAGKIKENLKLKKCKNFKIK